MDDDAAAALGRRSPPPAPLRQLAAEGPAAALVSSQSGGEAGLTALLTPESADLSALQRVSSNASSDGAGRLGRRQKVSVAVFPPGPAPDSGTAELLCSALMSRTPGLGVCSPFGFFGIRARRATRSPSSTPPLEDGPGKTSTSTWKRRHSVDIDQARRRGSEDRTRRRSSSAITSPGLPSTSSCGRPPELPPQSSLRRGTRGALLSQVTGTQNASTQRGREPQRRSFTNVAFHPLRMFPCSVRLGHAFLSLVGRVQSDYAAPGVPGVALRPLHEQDAGRIITLSAETVESVSASSDLADPAYEELVATQETQRPDARLVWGPREFSISVGAVRALVASTHVESSTVPALFVRALMAELSCSEGRTLCGLLRDTPLSDICLHDATADRLQRRLEDTFSRAARAESVHTKSRTRALAKLEALLASGRQSGMAASKRRGSSGLIRDATNRARFLSDLRNGQCERETVDAEELAALEWDVAEANFRLYSERVHGAVAKQQLRALADPAIISFARRFELWVSRAAGDHSRLGFPSPAEVFSALGMTFAEIAVGACVSQQGYFFVDGCHGGHNQLSPAPPVPTTFLFTSAIDFSTVEAAAREAPRYFRVGGRGTVTSEFTADGAERLRQRALSVWRSVYQSAQHHCAKVVCMTPVGLGSMLERLPEDASAKVRSICLEAQLDALCEGAEETCCGYTFDEAWVNPGALRGAYESTLRRLADQGRRLKCTIVLHDRDTKFLSCELAKAGRRPAFVCPTDAVRLLQGLPGGCWETARGDGYSTEEDCVATSTTCLLAALRIGDRIPK